MTNSRRKGKVGEEWRPVKGFEGIYLNHTIPEFKGKFTKGDAKTLWR